MYELLSKEGQFCLYRPADRMYIMTLIIHAARSTRGYQIR